MPRGRLPQPTESLKLRGSEHADRPAEPRPKPGLPKAPKRLSAAAKREWRAVAGELEAAGIATRADVPILADYCTLTVEQRELEALIAEQGRTFTTPQGYIAANPAVGMLNRVRDHRLKLMRELGMSPSARPRIRAVAPDGPADSDPAGARQRALELVGVPPAARSG